MYQIKQINKISCSTYHIMKNSILANYMICTAVQIIGEVAAAVKEWQTLARKLSIANREVLLFEKTFNDRLKGWNK